MVILEQAIRTHQLLKLTNHGGEQRSTDCEGDGSRNRNDINNTPSNRPQVKVVTMVGLENSQMTVTMMSLQT